MKVLVTGSNGFIGRNLVTHLQQGSVDRVLSYDQGDDINLLWDGVAEADVIFHLAGVNRPQTVDEFETVNAGLTAAICERLRPRTHPPVLVLASSIQAALDNPYGTSKRHAEEFVMRYAAATKAPARIFRFQNVFGKWCRPNYNSVVATFCYNIAHDLPITISDPNRELELIYIDDVVRCLMAELEASSTDDNLYHEVSPSYQIALGELADLVRSFRRLRQNLVAPDFGSPFVQKLYATYLSYLEPDDLAHDLDKKCDPRGCLAEFLKSPAIGQIFVSRTGPGITRGNHYHHTKTEQFLVLEGEAVIRFRHIHSGEVIEYPVRGDEFRVVDIPPGYTHSIENVGDHDLITLFWASEIFDPQRPDTISLPVILEPHA